MINAEEQFQPKPIERRLLVLVNPREYFELIRGLILNPNRIGERWVNSRRSRALILTMTIIAVLTVFLCLFAAQRIGPPIDTIDAITFLVGAGTAAIVIEFINRPTGERYEPLGTWFFFTTAIGAGVPVALHLSLPWVLGGMAILLGTAIDDDEDAIQAMLANVLFTFGGGVAAVLVVQMNSIFEPLLVASALLAPLIILILNFLLLEWPPLNKWWSQYLLRRASVEVTMAVVFTFVTAFGLSEALGAFDAGIDLGHVQMAAVAALVTIAAFRLPFWPLECAWAYVARARSSPLPEAYDRRYPDGGMFVPIPGQVAMLCEIAQGMQSASFVISCARKVNAVISTTRALQRLAQNEPIAVQTQVGGGVEFSDSPERIVRFVERGLRPPAAEAWAAYALMRSVVREYNERRAHDYFTSPDGKSRPQRLMNSPILQMHQPSRSIDAIQIDIEFKARFLLNIVEQWSGSSAGAVPALYLSLMRAQRFTTLDEIPTLDWPELPADRPEFSQSLREAMKDLEAVREIVEVFVRSSSTGRRSISLLDAMERLGAVSARADLSVEFEQLIKGVTDCWRLLLTAAGGEIARADSAGPIANPYVAGNPVTGDLFVGRDDILRKLDELWSREQNSPSVVIYGHRRMGKTSILQEVGPMLGDRYLVVYFNLQRTAQVATTAELLISLALSIFDEFDTRFPGRLDEPDPGFFASVNATIAFNRFLRQLGDCIENQLIVELDEFEKLESLMREGHIDSWLMEYFRGLIMTYSWLVLAFAGLHTLEEMRQDYFNPLFASVRTVHVSFLAPSATRVLLTRPTVDFSLEYEDSVVQRVVDLTNGQPYLVQLIGYALVARRNDQFIGGRGYSRPFNDADLDEVLAGHEFFDEGDAYFSGVWQQASQYPPGQDVVLKAIAQSPIGRVSQTELVSEVTAAGLARGAMCNALAALVKHDVVVEHDGSYKFAVELMRVWVAKRFELLPRLIPEGGG